MKAGYLSDSVKILIFAAAVIITCMLVTLGFSAAETAKDLSNSAVIQMAELNNDIKDSDIKQYDEAEVYGSDVVNFIRKYLGDFTALETAPLYVNVKTSVSENTYTNGTEISNIRNFTNAMYIKPTAVFAGKVMENDNNVVVGIMFTQK